MKTIEFGNVLPDIGDQELYIRPGDRELCQNLCNAIANENKNLIITGSTSSIVEHYCGLIVRKLLALVDARIAIQPLTSTSELLDTFNENLSSLSTAEAMAERNPASPVRIWILESTGLATPVEIRLLARLISSFPGANIQFILLHTGYETQHAEDAPGKNTLKLRTTPPSQAEVDALISHSRAAGKETDAIDLVNRIAPESLAAHQSDQLQNGSVKQVVKEWQPNSSESVQNNPSNSPSDKSLGWSPVSETVPWKLRIFFNFLMGICLLVLAAIIVAPLFPKQVRALWHLVRGQPQLEEAISPQKPISDAQSSPLTSFTGKRPADNVRNGATIDSLVWAETELQPTTSNHFPGKTHPTVTPSVEPSKAIQFPTKATPDRSIELRSITDIAKTPEGAEKSQAALTAPSKPRFSESKNSVDTISPPLADATSTEEKTKRNQSAGNMGRPLVAAVQPASLDPLDAKAMNSKAKAIDAALKIILESPTTTTFVQHVARSTYEDAKEWQSQHPALASAFIAPVKSNTSSAILYIVASGPFESRISAESFSKMPGVPRNPWLRTGASLIEAVQHPDKKNQLGKN